MLCKDADKWVASLDAFPSSTMTPTDIFKNNSDEYYGSGYYLCMRYISNNEVEINYLETNPGNVKYVIYGIEQDKQ